jgi:hypothetical protein
MVKKNKNVMIFTKKQRIGGQNRSYLEGWYHWEGNRCGERV